MCRSVHYADGRVVKDESIESPDYSIDGDASDEIDSAIVKSGTTTERFDCAASNSPPRRGAGDQDPL
jgi:hypothetical protein